MHLQYSWHKAMLVHAGGIKPRKRKRIWQAPALSILIQAGPCSFPSLPVLCDLPSLPLCWTYLSIPMAANATTNHFLKYYFVHHLHRIGPMHSQTYFEHVAKTCFPHIYCYLTRVLIPTSVFPAAGLAPPFVSTTVKMYV